MARVSLPTGVLPHPFGAELAWATDGAVLVDTAQRTRAGTGAHDLSFGARSYSSLPRGRGEREIRDAPEPLGQ
jgi:hypothetical protein